MKLNNIILGMLLAVHTANATTITVTGTADSGAGTLRGALASAANGDTIDATGVSGTILLTSGELLVTNSVTILGPGPANLAVDGNATGSVFHITPSNTVTIASLTITNGNVNGGRGAGIYNYHATLTVSNCTLGGNSGGAIWNDGGFGGSATLTIASSTISGNSGGNGGNATLTVSNSTICSNSVQNGGGGIFNTGQGGSATLTIANSTISDNMANFSFGGAIWNDALFGGSATLTIANSTVSGNSGLLAGGIYTRGENATVEIGNTILNVTSPGINGNAAIIRDSGTVTSLGYNLGSDDGGGYLTNTTDRINTDPLLGPLQDNGGPTFTQALLPGSPAIDQGRNFSAATTDQRGIGYARTFDDPAAANAPRGDGTDIGALERQALPNQPPVAKCHNVTVSAGSDCMANASIDNGSFDPDAADAITLTQSPAGPYDSGTTVVTLTVTDNHGASDSCMATVTVVDTTSPTISGVSVDKPILWPPNHKLVEVTINYDATDNCDPSPLCTLSVTSNDQLKGGHLEKGEGPGHKDKDDDDKEFDWIILDAHHLKLRADRSESAEGRVYWITVTCKDRSGNYSTRKITVRVPAKNRD